MKFWGHTVYKKMCQKNQCFSQVFTDYFEWNLERQMQCKCFLLDSLVFYLFRRLCSIEGLCVKREGWFLCGLCYPTPFCPLGASSLCQLTQFSCCYFCLRSPSLQEQLGEGSPESIHPAEGACGLFWCLLVETL